MNAQMNIADILNLASRVEDPRLKGEILYHLLDILELEDDREGVIDETSLLTMEVLRKEVNLGTDYVGLYKVYRDCEATAAHNTFAKYCNSVVREVAYELLCVMAERGRKFSAMSSQRRSSTRCRTMTSSRHPRFGQSTSATSQRLASTSMRTSGSPSAVNSS